LVLALHTNHCIGKYGTTLVVFGVLFYVGVWLRDEKQKPFGFGYVIKKKKAFGGDLSFV